jgi:hypothetical protein
MHWWVRPLSLPVRAQFGLLAFLFLAPLAARDRVASIEFFGYQGLDPEAVRKALPYHEGDPLARDIKAQTRAVVKRITGRDATDVALICCINDGDTAVFIGLPGASSRTIVFNPSPKQDVRLSPELLALMRAMSDAENSATIFAEVDTRPGYRLMKDPRANAAELKVREYAIGHSDELLRVLSNSSDHEQRASAADALGYAGRSGRQLATLVLAARDSDETVRNNATRALGEILDADSSVSAQISPAPFLELARSGTWTDRNKASMVLEPMTKSRNLELLARIKAEAWDALMEMARWHTSAWAGAPRMTLLRISGLPEERILLLSFAQPEAFLEAIAVK